MRLAFYAPLKAPDHPTPSGDRNMARSLMTALRSTGAEVTLASNFASRDGTGDTTLQAERMSRAIAQHPELIAQGQSEGWAAWITYHNYYKAPDLLGPAVAKALKIPYLLIEATRASKRLQGPWATFAEMAERATDAADVVFYLTERDAEALRRDAPADQALIHLRPFLNRTTLPKQSVGNGPILSVGMMRHGDKLASYALIAQTLSLLPKGTWQLHIAGDGPASDEVRALMAPFGDAVTYLGALDAEALADAYAQSSCLLWPGVNEAFGMTYLEAQAAGLPVIAQDRPGVRDVLAPGSYPLPQAGVAAMATQLQDLLNNADTRKQAGQAARAYVAHHHLRNAAQQTLCQGLHATGVSL